MDSREALMLTMSIQVVKVPIVGGVTTGTTSSRFRPIETLHTESILELRQNEAVA